MARGKVHLIKGERPLIQITGHFRNQGHSGETRGIQGLMSEIVNVSSSHLVPEELIEGVITHLKDKNNHKSRMTSNITPESKLTNAAIQQIVSEIEVIPSIHLAYYRALLNSMQDVLDNPGVVAKSRGPIDVHRRVSLHLTKAASYGNWKAGDREIVLTSGSKWRSLRRSTVAAKKKLSKDKQVFWKHTGRLAKVFSSSRRAQLSGLTSKDFVGATKRVPFLDFNQDTRFRLSKGKFAHKANITMEIGVPQWRNKGENYMDTIVTNAFAGDSPGALGGFFRIENLPKNKGNVFRHFESPLTRLIKARNKNQNKRIEGNFYDIRRVDANETSLRRILAPEFRRPWLRNLSKITGAKMRGELSNLFR